MGTHLSIGLLATMIAVMPLRATAGDPPSSTKGEIQTPERAGTANLVEAAKAPLHDLNLSRQDIPPILLAAITNPYDRPRSLDCGEITRQVRALSVALGADFDEPETPQAPSLTQKNGKVALALVHGAAETVLPFSGFVRTLSGARKHDQLIIEAITAGSVRRGYLKGLGESRHCPRPASPVHFLRPPPPAEEEGPGPRFPIR